MQLVFEILQRVEEGLQCHLGVTPGHVAKQQTLMQEVGFALVLPQNCPFLKIASTQF